MSSHIPTTPEEDVLEQRIAAVKDDPAKKDEYHALLLQLFELRRRQFTRSTGDDDMPGGRRGRRGGRPRKTPRRKTPRHKTAARKTPRRKPAAPRTHHRKGTDHNRTARKATR